MVRRRDCGALVDPFEILMIAVAAPVPERGARAAGQAAAPVKRQRGAPRGDLEPTLHHIATDPQAKWLIADGTLRCYVLRVFRPFSLAAEQ